MTPQDHNKTLGIAHGLVGVLILIALLIVATFEIRERSSLSDGIMRIKWGVFLLAIPLLQLLGSYGLWRKRSWGRILVLIFSALYVWVFPLGTALASYTWWFFHSSGSKELYGK
jgi:uncharacterized membrane protein